MGNTISVPLSSINEPFNIVKGMAVSLNGKSVQTPKYVRIGSYEHGIRARIAGELSRYIKDNPAIQKPKNETALHRAFEILEKKYLNAAYNGKLVKVAWLDNMNGILKKLAQIR